MLTTTVDHRHRVASVGDGSLRPLLLAARSQDAVDDAVTEMDALVAYLQMLGTLVDFKLYDDKADLR